MSLWYDQDKKDEGTVGRRSLVEEKGWRLGGRRYLEMALYLTTRSDYCCLRELLYENFYQRPNIFVMPRKAFPSATPETVNRCYGRQG